MVPTTLHGVLSDAPPELCEILNHRRGAIQSPIRSEIFGPQRFAQHGRSLGETHRATCSPVGGANFFPRIKDNLKTLREANHYIGVQASMGYDVSPAAEWLLDNFHLIETQLSEINAGLPRSYFSALPKLLDEPLAGLPRVYGIAWAFVAHTDGAFDEAMLVHFLSAYQEVRELNLSEMWALPTTLRVVLIENLRRLAEHVAVNKAAREAANVCFDHIDHTDLDAHNTVLGLLNTRGVGRVFLVQLALRLQDLRLAEPSAEHLLFQNWLHTALPELAVIQLQQEADPSGRQPERQQRHYLLARHRRCRLARHHRPHQHLDAPDAGLPIFEAEATLTRDQTLHAIERLAVRCKQSELTVARTLLTLMCTPGSINDVRFSRRALARMAPVNQSCGKLWACVDAAHWPGNFLQNMRYCQATRVPFLSP